MPKMTDVVAYISDDANCLCELCFKGDTEGCYPVFAGDEWYMEEPVCDCCKEPIFEKFEY